MDPQTLMVHDVLGLGSLVKLTDSVFGIAVFEHFTLDSFLVACFVLGSVFVPSL